MKRRAARLASMLATVLACVLVSSTSFALYRTSLGPKACCASHCRHAMPQRAAARCCQLQATVTPGAIGTVAHPDPEALPVALVPFTPTRREQPATLIRTAFLGPPGGTLLTHHTSLTL